MRKALVCPLTDTKFNHNVTILNMQVWLKHAGNHLSELLIATMMSQFER